MHKIIRTPSNVHTDISSFGAKLRQRTCLDHHSPVQGQQLEVHLNIPSRNLNKKYTYLRYTLIQL